MKLFLDANILVSVLNKEYPLFTYTSRILSLADRKDYSVFTSPICLAIAFYFAEKKFKNKLARQKIKTLCEHISIADATEAVVKQTVSNAAIHDFEDGLEYYSALAVRCDCIITEDRDDFYFSDIEVLDSRSFFERYLAVR